MGLKALRLIKVLDGMSGFGVGCTLGAFFSAIPSLALNGWVYGAGLCIGAYVGVQIIKRFP